jgi:hypothetical protein
MNFSDVKNVAGRVSAVETAAKSKIEAVNVFADEIMVMSAVAGVTDNDFFALNEGCG